MALKFNFKEVGLKVAGLAAGSIGADMIGGYIPGSNTIKAVGKIAIGAFAPSLMGKKSALFTAIGDGMIANGATQLVKSLGITGIGEVAFDEGVNGIEEGIGSVGENVNGIS